MLMNMKKELNHRLFIQREEQTSHIEYKEEYGYYDNIVAGNLEAVRQRFSDPENEHQYNSPGYGRLSENPIRNTRYHFIVSVALITRLCVENGLERELAYTLSDLYISKMDLLQTTRQILVLHNEMLLDFTQQMAGLPKRQVYSVQVIKAMDYIYKNLNGRLSVTSIAKSLGLNGSYLSYLFHKETGINISQFIHSEKTKAASNMLRFSEYSYSDIASYFGFSSQSHFIKCFRKETGYTPMEYRKRFSLVTSFGNNGQTW